MQLLGFRPSAPSVRLSVHLSFPTAAAAGLLPWARRPADINRLLHSGQSGGQQPVFILLTLTFGVNSIALLFSFPFSSPAPFCHPSK